MRRLLAECHCVESLARSRKQAADLHRCTTCRRRRRRRPSRSSRHLRSSTRRPSMTMHGIRSCLRLCRPRAASSRRRATSRYACGTPSRARCVLTASASLALDYRRPPLTVTHRHAARTRPSITWTKWPLPTRSPSARLARSTYAAHARALSRTTHLTRAPLPASIYCGFQRAVRVFDVSRPGRQVATFESKSRHLGAQAGIISTIAVSPHTKRARVSA